MDRVCAFSEDEGMVARLSIDRAIDRREILFGKSRVDNELFVRLSSYTALQLLKRKQIKK